MKLFFTLIPLIGIVVSPKNPCPNNCQSRNENASKPNIVIILADDMGWNDVSIHGSSQIPTPNIDALGILGIQLNQMYVAPMCTPSRSALMTGKYESNVGMQHYVIASSQPYGLDPKHKTMADYMRQGGYRTYLIGKWHLGFYEKRNTPLFRGFDSHYGYLSGYIDYFNHSTEDFLNATGYDMRENLSVAHNKSGQYATDLFTEKTIETIKLHDKTKSMFLFLSHLAPHAGNDYVRVQAPESEINKFSYIKDLNRRKYAAMVSKLDQSVGKTMERPFEGLLSNFGYQKDGPWEGAVRSAAAIWSPLLKRRHRVSNQMIHISDWLPTFANIAGINIDDKLDGKDMWSALSYDLPSPRKEILVHHDPVTPYMAYIKSNFKLIIGSTSNGTYDRYLSNPIDSSEENSIFKEHYTDVVLSSDTGRILSKYSSIQKDHVNHIRRKSQVTCNGHSPPDSNSIFACNPLKSPCLFDILDDPCETTNLALKFPRIVESLQTKLGMIAEPVRNKPSDPRSNPNFYNGVWIWWYDVLYYGSDI